MRRLNFTILIAMLMSVGTLLQAQDTIRHLVISEVRVDNWNYAFVELTNMGDSTIHMDQFLYGMLRDNQPQFHLENNVVYLNEGYTLWDNSHTALHGTLDPGDSYILMSVQSTLNGSGIYPTTVHSLDLLERADTVIFFHTWGGGDKRFETFPIIPEWELWGRPGGSDTVSATPNVVFHRHNDAPSLYWTSGDTIQVFIDQALGTMEWDESGVNGNYINNTNPPKSVAGVQDAHDDYTLVRKFTIKEGETNWSLATGSDPTSSSWMLIPKNNDFNRMAFETEGYHGDFQLDYSSDVYDIDEANNVLTVPWGTEKDDSIRLGFTLGKGMAWEYVEQPSAEDSLSNVCVTGDTLILYATGNELQTRTFQIEVAEPAGDMVKAVPRHTISYPDPEDPEWTPEEIADRGPVIYGITKGLDMDSIFEIPYATPIDTFLMLIDIAPNATWEFNFASGVESAELSWGDQLVITGGDGSTTKTYHLAVNEYEPNDDITMRAITWPDKPEAGLWEGWKGDTIPNFSTNGLSYSIDLPPGTVNVPALVYEPWNLNTKLEVERAVSLSGSVAERTTTVNITSESDTLGATIKIVFNVFNPFPQKYVADPIFAKFVIRDWWSAGGMEILNASDELIDLSNYMIVKSNEVNYADAVMNGWDTDSTAGWLHRWQKIVPGYKWQGYQGWQVEPGLLEIDQAIDPYIQPKDVKSFWVVHPSGGWQSYWSDVDPAQGGVMDYLINNDDFDPGIFANPWGEPLNRESTFAFPLFPRGASDPPTSLYYMLKIIGDSVRTGEKPANDPEDFEVVDTWGSPIVPWVVDGVEWLAPPGESYSIYRKSDKYWGTTVLGDNFGDEMQSHFTHRQDYAQNPQARTYNQKEFGSHPMDPITGHLSTVTSLVYKVSGGFEGDQSVEGVSRGEDVDAFLANITKADPTQTLMVKNGGEKAGDAAVAEGDTLIVTAQTGTETLYIISLAALDGDNLLVAAAGSGLTVEKTDATGSVSGFEFGTTLKELTADLTVPALAVMNVLDMDGNLVPMSIYNTDTVKVDVIATQNYVLEVTAQNSDKCVYSLMPDASDAMVVSSVYTVMEEPIKVIAGIQLGTAVPRFMASITASEGATVKIMIKTGQERVDGQLNTDDVLVVTSADGNTTVVYALNFLEELSAYVTSDVFGIDQENSIIDVPEKTTVESLVAGLVPAPQATMMVKDVDGNEKTTGEVLATDMVVVTSGDERNELTYSINILPTSVYADALKNLKLYPNPAEDILYVDNVPADANIRISDITGRIHAQRSASDIAHGIELSGMENGLYFLTIEMDGKALTTVKFIKK